MLAFIIIQVYTNFGQKEKMPVGDRRYHGAFTII